VAVFAPEGRRSGDGGNGDGEAEGKGMRQWSTATFEVRSGTGVPAGLDGEAVTLEPPVHFASRPAALRVRIAPHHPGASPSAGLPATARELLPQLLHVAFGHSS
jgi:hypothetical protein